MKRYIVSIIIPIFVAITILGIIIIIGSSTHIDRLWGVYEFFDNQTVSILIGFIAIFLSYSIWKKQHNTKLSSEYFEKLLEVTLTILYIDDALVWMFKGQRNERSDTLFREKMVLNGKRDTYMMLLEKLGDTRPEQIQRIQNEYADKYIDLLAKCRHGGLESVQEEYSSLRKKVRSEILSLITNN